MMTRTFVYILISFVVSYLIRILPLTLVRKQIDKQFVRSFLYYVPYVTLAIMTFPAIIETTQSPISGMLALIFSIIFSFFGVGLFGVACVSCVTVLITEFCLGF